MSRAARNRLAVHRYTKAMRKACKLPPAAAEALREKARADLHRAAAQTGNRGSGGIHNYV